MRILMVASSYYPVFGGLENNLRQLCARLSARGHQVTVLTRSQPGAPASQDDQGAKIVRLNCSGGLGFVWAAGAWLLRHRDFEVMHCHQALSPALIGALSKWIVKAPVLVLVVATGRFGEAAEMQRRPFFWLRRRLLGKIDCFLTLSANAAAELDGIGLGRVPVRQIPNGVDTALFRPADEAERGRLRAELGLGRFQRVLVFTGRLDQVKNLPWLIKGWRESGRAGQGDALVLVGEGAQRQELEALAQGPEQGSVVFAGAKENVADYLRAADALALVSISEGMPNALLEAMSCGLPSVVTPVGAVPQMIEDGVRGLVVERDDDAGLAAAIAKVLGNHEQAARMGRAAREYIEQNHDFERVADLIVGIYKTVLAED